MEFLTVMQINEYLNSRIIDPDYIQDVINSAGTEQPEIVRYLCSTEITRFNEIEISYLILCGLILYDIFMHFHGDISFVTPRQLKGIEEDNINIFYKFLDDKSNDAAALMKLLSESSSEPNAILVPVQFYQGFRKKHKYDMKEENYIFSLMHFKTLTDAISANSRKKFFREKAPEKFYLTEDEKSSLSKNFNLQSYMNYYNEEKAADYGRKVGRNELCPCGSGKKYKKCCSEEQ